MSALLTSRGGQLICFIILKFTPEFDCLDATLWTRKTTDLCNFLKKKISLPAATATRSHNFILPDSNCHATYTTSNTPRYQHNVVSRTLSFTICTWHCTYCSMSTTLTSYYYIYTHCLKKHVTTYSVISWTRTVRLRRFLAQTIDVDF